MADFNINHISNKNGEQGPTISGITTVNSTGAMRIPSGGTVHGRILKEDPYYEFGSILSPFNEKKYSTAFTDRSKHNDGWVVTNNVNANDNGKFYPAGAYFDGTDDRLEIPQTLPPSPHDYELGGRFSGGTHGSWTWETWFYHVGSHNQVNSLFTDNTADQVSNGYYGRIITLNGEDGHIELGVQNNNGSNYTYIFDDHANGYTPRVTTTSDAWNHVAITYDGEPGIFRQFINGTLSGTVGYVHEEDIWRKYGIYPNDVDMVLNYPRRDLRSARVHVGANHNNVHEFKGYLQDYRYYNGVCKYKESFTPPTQMAFGELR